MHHEHSRVDAVEMLARADDQGVTDDCGCGHHFFPIKFILGQKFELATRLNYAGD